MKKVLFLLSATLVLFGCQNNDILIPEPTSTDVVKELKIVGNVGIKVQNPFVTGEVAMNVKAETAGTYIVKILNIANKPVSKEEVNIKAGDNVLKIYANALPSSAYRIALFDASGNLLGITDFNKL